MSSDPFWDALPMHRIVQATVVGAEPGTRLIGHVEDGEAFVSPVVAWVVDGEGSPVPVTARGPHDGIPDRDYVVEFPGGAVISPDVGTWPSRAAYQAGVGQLALPLGNGPTSIAA